VLIFPAAGDLRFQVQGGAEPVTDARAQPVAMAFLEIGRIAGAARG
jgi:hypothetical protein